jgi:hypothetical protein
MSYAQHVDVANLYRSMMVRRLVWFNLRLLDHAHLDWCGDVPKASTESAQRSQKGANSSEHARATRNALGGGVPAYWAFTDPIERIFLLDLERFRSIVLDVGLSMHRSALLSVLSGQVMRATKDVMGVDRVEFVIQQSESIADQLTAVEANISAPDFHSLVISGEEDAEPLRQAIERDGAITLMEILYFSPADFFDRAKLRWPRAWSLQTSSVTADEAKVAREIITENVLRVRLRDEKWLF